MGSGGSFLNGQTPLSRAESLHNHRKCLCGAMRVGMQTTTLEEDEGEEEEELLEHLGLVEVS